MQHTDPMRNLSFLLSTLAAVTLVTAGCSKKAAVKQPAVATDASKTKKPGADADKKKTGETGDVSLTSDDTSGTAPPSGPIYFEFDSATLTEASRDLLSTFGAWAVQKKPKLRIEGHTDEQGTTEYNLALGDRRARAIADYLIALGVAADRVDTVTYGEEKPAAEGPDEQAHAANRRGEVQTNAN